MLNDLSLIFRTHRAEKCRKSIYTFVHQLTQVKTGVMDWDIGQWKSVQSRPRTLVLILGRTIKRRTDRRDSQCTLAGKSESLSSSVCVGRNLISPLGRMPTSAAGWSQVDHGGLLGNISFFLSAQRTACFIPLLAHLLLSSPLSSTILWVSQRSVFNLEMLSASLGQVSSWWGRQQDGGVGVIWFWS